MISNEASLLAVAVVLLAMRAQTFYSFHEVFSASLLFLFGFGWVMCYGFWWYEGCTLYMPFVSDFGVGPPMIKYSFLYGIGVGGGLLLSVVWRHYQAVIPHVSDPSIRRLYQARLVAGSVLAFCVMNVGLNPCDTRPAAHGGSAMTCFVGGWVFGILTICIYCAEKRAVKEYALIVLFVAVSITFMALMIQSQNLMLHELLDPSFAHGDPTYATFDKFNPMTSLHYHHWCSGSSVTVPDLGPVPCLPGSNLTCPQTGPGPHAVPEGNFAAFCEWGLLLFNAAPCIGTMLIEFDIASTKAAGYVHLPTASTATAATTTA